MNIRDAIARRTDLGTFIVHLTKSSGSTSARTCLEQILQRRRIEARTMYGHAKSRIEADRVSIDSQKCVCFTETPLEYLHILIAEIESRSVRLEPYGIALTKKLARGRGVNPVWYVDITPGHDWLTKPIDELLGRAYVDKKFIDPEIERLMPFIEQMGSGTTSGGHGYRKEFWWEREWRHVGDFVLIEPFLGLCPESEMADFEKVATERGLDIRFIDPLWGLEQIIGHLAGFSSTDIHVL